MSKTNVKLQLPFHICDRCIELDVSATMNYNWTYENDTTGSAKRDIIVTCKHHEVCERLHRMVCEEIQRTQSGGEQS